MSRNYVSVTGITTAAQLAAVSVPAIDSHDVFLGWLVSTHSADGPVRLPRYASPEEIASRQDAVSIAHYCAKTATSERIASDVAAISRSQSVRGFQFNISSPERLRIATKVAAAFPRIKTFIFQMNKAMRLSLGDKGTLDLFDSLQYGKECHVLFDMSGGKGLPLSIDDAVAAREIASKYGMAFGVAGGLSSGNVGNVFAAMGSGISVDAESSVRNEDDTLCQEATNGFLAACARAIASEDGLDWDASIVAPSPKNQGTIKVKLIYKGRGKPIPVDDSGEQL
jgi:phosphoribosylanthranilate isomerase